jgi:cell division protein FtsI (penicillin-binding protein 3)
MGYQVGVTPLQMVTAVSAVANGGLLMHPYVVRAVVRDGTREVVRPRVVRRAIEPETAAVIREMMEGVVERGTAKTAQIAGYRSAGKTGTAHKVLRTGGGYSPSDYNASFVGFVPSRDPKFAILVVIDSPRRKGHYGGVVAAPIFRRVAEAALQQAGIPGTVAPEDPVVVRAGMSTLPAPEVSSVRLQSVGVEAGGPALMPDVRGLSARDAMRLLGRAGLSVRLAGAGFVTTQTPSAGTGIRGTGWALIELGRPTANGSPSRETHR